jgi:sialic acid synthase
MFKDFCKNGEPFVIAEVGQNHNGDFDKAREYIRIFALCGANAIKFQTRNNKYLFSKDAYDAAYESENSYGLTYGEHREKLELRPEWLPILKQDCHKHGVYFMSTPFDEPSLNIIENVGVDIIKVASFDLGNLPFLNRIAKIGKPLVISVGGGRKEQIQSSIKILKNNQDIAILHCVSEYPCEYHRLGLNNVEFLAKNYPEYVVGLSDHFNGILSGPIAYMKGARIFEKHVTLDRSSKGTDHSFSLEPEGFKKFVRDIKRVRYMLPPKEEGELGSEKVFKKLGKSLIAHVDIREGERITIESLSGRIFKQEYIPVRESNVIIGKVARRNINRGEPISFQDIL